MNDITKMVIATAMRKMYEGRYFDICTVDQCLKVAGIIAPKQEYELLRTLHCVPWGDMPRELAEQVPVLMSRCFDGLKIEDLMKACEPAAARLASATTKRLQ